MEPLRNGNPGPNECWDELAEHSLTHDDLGSPAAPAAAEPTGFDMSYLAARLPWIADDDYLPEF